jgi:hypothetical protein
MGSNNHNRALIGPERGVCTCANHDSESGVGLSDAARPANSHTLPSRGNFKFQVVGAHDSGYDNVQKTEWAEG